jgi:hypothetical protein
MIFLQTLGLFVLTALAEIMASITVSATFGHSA